jgi:TP901 family phage tail tape measure protein
VLNLTLANAVVKVTVDRSQFEAGLAIVVSRLNVLRGLGTIQLRLDRAAATSGLNLLQQQLNALRASSNINVTATRRVVGGSGGGGFFGGGGGPGLGTGLAQGLGIAGFASSPLQMAGQVVGSTALDSVRTAIGLEASFADLQRVSGQTAGAMGDFKKTIFDISTRQAGVSVQDLIQIAGTGARMGVADREGTGGLATFTESMAMVRNAVAGIGTEQLADQMSRISYLFGLGTDRLAGMGSALVALDNVSTSTAGDILEITTGLSGTAANIRMTLPQLMAFASLLKDVGLSNQLAASSFSQIFRMMHSDTEGFAAKIGVDAGAFRNALETDVMSALKMAVGRFREIAGSSSVEGQEFLAQLGFKGVRTAGSFQQLAAKMDDFDARAQMASSETGSLAALEAANEIKSKTTENAILRFTNALTAFQDAFGSTLLPRITDIVNMGTTALKGGVAQAALGGVLSLLPFGSEAGAQMIAQGIVGMQDVANTPPGAPKPKLPPLPAVSPPKPELLPAALRGLPLGDVAAMAAKAGNWDLAATLFAKAAEKEAADRLEAEGMDLEEVKGGKDKGEQRMVARDRRRDKLSIPAGRAKLMEAILGKEGGGKDEGFEDLLGELLPEKKRLGVGLSGADVGRNIQADILNDVNTKQLEKLDKIDKGIEELNKTMKLKPGLTGDTSGLA